MTPMEVTLSAGITDDPTYDEDSWTIVGLDSAMYSENIYEGPQEDDWVINTGQYMLSDKVDNIKAQWTNNGLRFTMELKNGVYALESSARIIVKFVKAFL